MNQKQRKSMTLSERNARWISVYLIIKYLRTLGFSVTNDILRKMRGISEMRLSVQTTRTCKRVFTKQQNIWKKCSYGTSWVEKFGCFKISFQSVTGRKFFKNLNSQSNRNRNNWRGTAGDKEADDFCIRQLLPNKLKDQYCFKTESAIMLTWSWFLVYNVIRWIRPTIRLIIREYANVVWHARQSLTALYRSTRKFVSRELSLWT